MTVTSQVNQVDYIADGVTLDFPISFYFLEETHIQVVVSDASGTIYPVMLDVDYTVSGAGNPSGGNLHFIVAPLDDLKIAIIRNVPATQLTDYQPNDDFPAESHERALDKLTMLIQQAFAGISNSLQKTLSGLAWDFLGLRGINVGAPVDPTDVATKGYADTLNGKTVRTPEDIPALPVAASRIGMLLGFDGAGNPYPSAAVNGSATDLEARLRDPVNPLNGTGIVGRSVMAVDSIAALLLCPRRTDLRYSVKGYIAGTDFGGGQGFYWNDTSVEVENLVTVFAVPGVPVGRFYRGGPTGSILVDDAGAQPGVLTSQRAAIERADAVALATGAALCFRGGVTYYADELFIKSTVVLGNETRILKTATTDQGFFNWGNKPAGIVDGWISGFELDGNGQANVVTLRLYGNHTRPRIRNMVLLDSDFYAFGVGTLTSPGDKTDQIDGLDIDSIYIESNRGNVSLSTDYSFGLECFPGVICKDWKIRNVTTRGKIINKIHSVINLDLDFLDFKATTVFDPQSSGYCELNNCKNLKVGSNCIFDSGGTNSFYAFLIGGARVVGGQTVTNASMSGNVIGRMAITKVEDVRITDECRVSLATDIYDVNNSIEFGAAKLDALVVPAGSTGSTTLITLNGTIVDRNMRINVPGYVVSELVVNGGVHTLNATTSRFEAVVATTFNGTIFKLRGAPQTFALSVKTGKLTLNEIYMDGGGTWDRPFFTVDVSGQTRLIKSTIENMVSSTLHTSGGQLLTLSVANVINSVFVP